LYRFDIGEASAVDFSVSLKKSHEFRRLYAKGKSQASNLIVVYCRRNRSELNRVGITVSAKLGGAVIRNRVRRRLREAYRLSENQLKSGFDIVIVARTKCQFVSFDELRSDLLRIFTKLGIKRSGE